MSSNNLSNGVEDFFSSSDCEVSYGSLTLFPQSFQDDLCCLSLDPLSVQLGNDRFENLAESKLLDYNLKKSYVIILGAKKARKELIRKFEDFPPTLYGNPVQVVEQQSYLGDQIGINISTCVSLTINKRVGLAKRAIFDIKRIIEDCRSGVPGSVKTGLLLWESSVIPFLLNNCSTWFQMKKSDIMKIEKLQNLFLNSLLGVFKCPISLMLWDLSVLSIHLRILKEKLILYHHITCLPQSSLAHQVLLVQERLRLPSLLDEVDQFLNKHEITDVKKFSKGEWKSFVKRTIHSENRETILKNAQKYKKIDYLELAEEEYGIKEYFSELNLAEARLKFRVRAKCVKTCKMHFPSDKQNIRTMFICPENKCSFVDSLSHWSLCESYAHLRQSRDLSDDSQLLGYYQEIINLRIEESIGK